MELEQLQILLEELYMNEPSTHDIYAFFQWSRRIRFIELQIKKYTVLVESGK